MTTDLVAFVRARVAEDRAAAEAATAGPWRTPGPDTVGQWNIYDEQWTVATATAYDHGDPMSSKPGARGPGYIDPDANAAHITRWDPARVIAECEAKLAIIDSHADPIIDPCVDRPRNDEDACRTLRILAAVYAPHPDYLEDWKP